MRKHRRVLLCHGIAYSPSRGQRLERAAARAATRLDRRESHVAATLGPGIDISAWALVGEAMELVDRLLDQIAEHEHYGALFSEAAKIELRAGPRR